MQLHHVCVCMYHPADVIPRSVYVIHDRCLAEIIEHFLQFTNVSDSLHLVFISDYFFLDVFDLITGSDSVDPGKLDPAAPHLTIIGPSRVHKQGVFVVILGEKLRHLS